jgi:hypothetical protein
VFVAPSSYGGSDANSGTRASPFATIAHAIANLGAKSRVYLCDGTFDKGVTITVGVNLYGGLACPNAAAGAPWSYVGGHASIAGQRGRRCVESGNSEPLKLFLLTGGRRLPFRRRLDDLAAAHSPSRSLVSA